MKNKGYTLIELLAVIIILASLIALVFPSIINFIKSSNEKKDNLTRDLVYNAAEMFIEDNASEYSTNNGSKYCITIDTLIENNYLKGDLEYEGETLDSAKSVRVTYTDKFNYEITDTDECTVCKLVSDSDASNSITVGDKYQCKVKEEMEEGFEDGYYFYVLSQDNESTANLIMERNMYYDSTNDVGKVATKSKPGLVAWLNETDYVIAGGTNWDSNIDRNMYGPITAMNYLYNSTKDWINIPNIIMDYIDEGNKGSYGYGNIKTIKELTQISQKDGTILPVLTNKHGYTNLRARMPRYSEVTGTGKCMTSNGSCPLWLSNYLLNSSYVTGEGLNNIIGINGYWIISSYNQSSKSSWIIYYRGYAVHFDISNSTAYGIRPVITIPNSLISN